MRFRFSNWLKWVLRWLRRGAVGVSLALFLLTVGLGIRSYFCSDVKAFSMVHEPVDARLMLVTFRGGLIVNYRASRFSDFHEITFKDVISQEPLTPWMVRGAQSAVTYGGAAPTMANRLGFFWSSWEDPPDRLWRGGDMIAPLCSGYYVYAVSPFWPWAVLFAILPCVWGVGRWRAARRVGTGLCPVCRYDLRAHRAGDKCPECGTVVAANVTS